MTPKEALAVLTAAFLPNKELPRPTVELYAAKMGDIHPDLLERVIHRLVERSKFFPAIAEIRTTAAELAGMLPMATEEAMAIVRAADFERPVFRRDGTYAYTEHEWRWPDDLSWPALGVIRAALSKAGESVTLEGKRVFGWELGFKAAYEREAVQVVADLDLREALPAPQAPHPKALAAPHAPAPKFASKMLEIVQAVVDKTLTEDQAHAEIQRLFDESHGSVRLPYREDA